MVINRYNNRISIKYRLFCKVVPVSIQKKIEQKYGYSSRLNKNIKNFINRFMLNKQPSKDNLFHLVEIETINKCNGECSFCPANKYNDKRKLQIMDDELFHKIIDELSSIRFTGRVALYSNNEPFLDTRMVDFIKYARNKLPNAIVYLFTNGTLLSLELYKKIIDDLDELIIDWYDDELQMSQTLVEIQNLCDDNVAWNSKTYIYLRKKNEVLFTRGGQSPNNGLREIRTDECILPYRQIVIRPDGKISLCCNDVFGKYTLGDANKDSLVDIWYSDLYWKYRETIEKNRSNVELCKYCDSKHDGDLK